MNGSMSRVRWLVAVAAGCGLVAGCTPKTDDKAAAAKAGTEVPAAVEVPSQPLPMPEKELATMDPATVLVEVDGVKLTAGEVDAQIQKMVGRSEQPVDASRLSSVMPRLRQQATEQFVVRTLLKNEATKANVTVSDEDLKKATAEIEKRLPEGMTLASAMEKDGLTMDQFKTNLTQELMIKKLVEKNVPTNQVPTEAEIAAFYEQQKERFNQPETVEARHILLKTEDGDKPEAKAAKKAKADDLRKQLVGGADFEKLARENSDCPSKERGGSLGSFGRGQMVKPFEDAAFSQATNAIGEVVETQFGYHIIQVMSHNEAKTSSLEEVKGRLTDYIKQRKQYEALETYINELKGKAKIVYPQVVQEGSEDEAMTSLTPAGQR